MPLGRVGKTVSRGPVLTGNADSDAARLDKLSEIASRRTPETIERALAAAKEDLGMDVAFVSEQRMVFRKLVGDARSFGWREGEGVPLDDTFCRLLVEGLFRALSPTPRATGG